MKARLISRVVAVALLAGVALAQQMHDPLNDVEIDQLRDAAMDPLPRLKLYVEFARARLTAMEQVRNDPKIKDRGAQVHDRLQAFLDVYDELDDNIDTYEKRDADLRKPLKLVVEADNEFQAKLRALKDATGVPEEEAKQYDFELADALDAVSKSQKDHRDLLAEQEEAAKHKKKSQSAPVREFL